MGKSKFTWVKTHKKLVKYLSGKASDQKELIELLKAAGAQMFNDRDKSGNIVELQEIDPFTFFCYIHKYGDERRIQMLQNIGNQLGLPVPSDFSGIPSANALKVWLFPYKKDRINNEVQRLWDFFYSALDNSITDEKFDDVVDIDSVGRTKITEGLFYILPEEYLPINAPTKPYLKEVLDIDPKFKTWTEYLTILEQVKKASDKPFYEISHDAWLWNIEQKKLSKYEDKWIELITRYKNYISENGIGEEQYKWEAIHHFQETFDPDANDFTENLKSAISKASNLVYVNSLGFIRKAVEYYPKEVREMFRDLYDESVPIKDRFQEFTSASEELLPRVSGKHGKKLNHQQDERTLSYYLTMQFPDRYPLYKNETYQYLISVLGDQKPRQAGGKFFHYLELAEHFIPAIENDEELIQTIRDTLSDSCYQGEQKWIIFQDILWVNMRSINSSNYWLFQANPSIFNIEKALKEEALSNWRVTSHKNKIKTGDKVILWASGERRGCYALCEVVSEVHEDRVNESEIDYYHVELKDEPFDQVELRITHNLLDNPITENQIKQDPRLTHLNIGNQGTNFSATKSEYETVVEMIEEKNFDPKWERLQKTVQKMNHEEAVRKFFNAIQQTLSELNLVEESPNFYAAAVDYYMHVMVGGKYLLYVEIKNDDLKLAFHIGKNRLKTLEEKYPDLEIHEGTKDTTLDSVFVKLNPAQVVVDDFIQPLVEIGRRLDDKYSKSSYRATYPEAYNPWIFRVAYSEDLLDKLLRGKKMTEANAQPEINYPLNTIFYGPPGTGKTYNTIKRAAEIVEGSLIESYDEAKLIFNDNLGDTIEFITFHQNYSYEDFIQGLRPDTENDKELTFDRVDGTFKKLADRALKNLENSKKPVAKKKPFEEVFNQFIQPLVEGEVEELEIEMKRVSYFITAVSNRSIEFRKTSGATIHTLSISTLKKMYEAEPVLEIQGLSSYYSPLLSKLLEIGKSPGETEIVKRKNYVLVIDEINRANISRVFGELITLIEEDKRYGRELHIPAKLPSGERFSVPSNLYIISTMNTADKSIALLDIALRRRFEFEAMYPRYKIDGEVIHDDDVLKKINERIIKLKGHDFQIGHSYFMKSHLTLRQRMNRKVIPLLLEYFMNDEKEVKDILTHAGLNIKENSWPLEITGRA